jgi:hypothetical protein
MVRSQDELLAMIDRILDSDYIDGLKAGEGYEIVQAQAKEFARISQAIRVTGDGLFAAYASGGSFATGIVEFYRTSTVSPACTVLAGTIVQARGGKLFRTIQDAVFGANDQGPYAVGVRSVFQEWQANTDGQTLTNGVLIPGEIDTIRTLIQDPLYADPTIMVRQIDPTVGGRAPMLDLLARGNNLRRNSGESDESLSYRTRNLPDNLTPGAMERMLRTLLGSTGARWEYVEPFELDFQTSYDAPEGSSVFTYDDPRPRYFPAINWYADDREQWATFYAVVGKIQPMADFGGSYDETIVTLDELRSPITGGKRAVPAFDAPDPGTYGEGLDLGMAYDARDTEQDALLNSVYDQMQSLRAAGIVAGLLKEGY